MRRRCLGRRRMRRSRWKQRSDGRVDRCNVVTSDRNNVTIFILMKHFALILLAIPLVTGAQQAAVKADNWASVNSQCAAFYAVIQSIVKPESRPEYQKKSNDHLRYARGLHDSSEPQPTRYKSDIALQTSELNAASSQEQKINFFRKGMLGCQSVASFTPLVIKEHRLSMKDE